MLYIYTLVALDYEYSKETQKLLRRLTVERGRNKVAISITLSLAAVSMDTTSKSSLPFFSLPAARLCAAAMQKE